MNCNMNIAGFALMSFCTLIPVSPPGASSETLLVEGHSGVKEFYLDPHGGESPRPSKLRSESTPQVARQAPGEAPAPEKEKRADREESPTSATLRYQGIALSIEVLPEGEQVAQTVADLSRHVFRTGDRIRLLLTSSFSGFPYVWESGRSGKLIYPPSDGSYSRETVPGEPFCLPSDGWFLLVEPAETFFVRVILLENPFERETAWPTLERTRRMRLAGQAFEEAGHQKGMVFEPEVSTTDPGLEGENAVPNRTRTPSFESMQLETVIAIELPIHQRPARPAVPTTEKRY